MRKVDFSALTDDFPLNQVEFRPYKSGIKDGVPFIQLYGHVDSRTIQRRLDEVVGAKHWQTKMVASEGGVICELSIEVEDGKWITKCDGAPINDTEGFKGACAKSLVRAASQFGIGRYLHDLTATYAEIVTENHPDAKWLNIDGRKVYWVAPHLGKSVFAHIPESADIDNDLEEIANSMVTFGYTKGKRLRDLNAQELASLTSFYQKVGSPKGRALQFRATFLKYVHYKKQGKYSAVA